MGGCYSKKLIRDELIEQEHSLDMDFVFEQSSSSLSLERKTLSTFSLSDIDLTREFHLNR